MDILLDVYQLFLYLRLKSLRCEKNSDHADEQKRRSHWGVGFLQSDQFYSAFVSATLVSRSQCEKGSGIEIVYWIDMLLLAPE